MADAVGFTALGSREDGCAEEAAHRRSPGAGTARPRGGRWGPWRGRHVAGGGPAGEPGGRRPGRRKRTGAQTPGRWSHLCGQRQGRPGADLAQVDPKQPPSPVRDRGLFTEVTSRMNRPEPNHTRETRQMLGEHCDGPSRTHLRSVQCGHDGSLDGTPNWEPGTVLSTARVN